MKDRSRKGEALSDGRTSSVSAALTTLEHLGIARESGVNEIARAMDMAPSRAHRLLKTLLDHGYVHQDPKTKRYRLGIKLFELGTSVSGRMSVRDAAHLAIQDLHERTQETVSLGILEGGEVLYLERIQTDDVLLLNIPPGRRVPAHSTALGKALLAAMDQPDVDEVLEGRPLQRLTSATITSKARLRKELHVIAQRGYATDDEEFVEGFRCAAAVIYGPRREAMGALSVSGPVHRVSDERLAALGDLVMQAANGVSARLGGHGHADPAPSRS